MSTPRTSNPTNPSAATHTMAKSTVVLVMRLVIQLEMLAIFILTVNHSTPLAASSSLLAAANALSTVRLVQAYQRPNVTAPPQSPPIRGVVR